MKRFAALAPLMLAACTVGPDYQKPDVPVPSSFRALDGVPGATTDLAHWWTGFQDPELESLITRALQSNLDLKTALSRLREARRQEIIAGAAGLPQVNATSDAVRLHSNSSPLAAVGGSGSSSGSSAAPSGTDLRLYSLGFDASWEVDIFGGVRRGVEAAQASAEAALWTVRDGEVSLTAEIAADYLELRGVQAQLAILDSELARQNDTVRLLRAQAQTGFITQLNVSQQQTQIDTTAAQIPGLEAQARTLEHAIAILLAAQPDALAGELEATAPLPTGPAVLPVALPSDLLRRRPDVRAAERQLAAATANIGVAIADLYPKFNLLAGLSLASSHFSSLFSGDSLGEFGLATISWPLFSAGKTQANIGAKQDERDQAYFAYQKAVLGAIKDSEDALTRCTTDQRRVDSFAHAAASASESAAIALQQYQAGLVTYLNVLTAQKDLLDAQNQLSQARAQRAADLVSAYKALGGGWDEAKTP